MLVSGVLYVCVCAFRLYTTVTRHSTDPLWSNCFGDKVILVHGPSPLTNGGGCGEGWAESVGKVTFGLSTLGSNDNSGR